MKEFDPDKVLASALTNCGFLEMSVHNYAQVAFSESTCDILKKRRFSDCLQVMIAIVSESGSIENDSIIPLLEEAIDLQEIRNAIAHNPLVMNMVVGAVQKIEHRLISSKTRQPLDRASGLEEINALAVRANELSGKISEAAGNLRSEQN